MATLGEKDIKDLTPEDITNAFGTINSTSLTPTPDLSGQLTNPNRDYFYPVAGLNNETTPPLIETAPELQADTLSTRIQALNDSLVGQSVYRTEQEKTQNIEGLTKTQNELSSRLTAIKNEAQAIPLQLQQESTGRGRTVGGLQPLQTASLRNNAIQALSVNSILEASRGNLSLAQDMVDRAVAAKYNPIKEEIAAKTANLDLILKSPAYSLAEKNRAIAQLDIQNRNKRSIERQEDNYKTAQAMAAAAVKNNPGNSGALLAANQLFKLDPSDTQYLQKAFSLLGQYQTDPNATAKAIAELAQTRAQTALAEANVRKINTEIRNMQPIVVTEGNAPYINAFNNAIAGVGSEASKQAKTVFAGYLNRGDLSGAKNYVVRTALANAGVDQQNQAVGRTQALSAMNDIQTLLVQAKARSSDTNIVSGTLVNVANKLGASPDTNLSYIGSRILQALITYRKGMTGVAFGPQEAADYKKIFPDITNIESLNTAKIQALKDSLNANNASALSFYIGQDNYDSLFPNQSTANLPSTKTLTVPQGQTRIINGHTYRSDGTQWVLSE